MQVPVYISQLGMHCCHVPSTSVGECCLHVLCINHLSVVVQVTHQGPTRMKTHAVKRIQPPSVEDKGDIASLQPEGKSFLRVMASLYLICLQRRVARHAGLKAVTF
jgi:hypothetical protein